MSDIFVVFIMKLFLWGLFYGKCEIFSRFLCFFDEGKKLDDNIVDFFMLYFICLFLEEDKMDSLYVFNLCFYLKIVINFNLKIIRNWIKNIDIFKKDVVVVLVC